MGRIAVDTGGLDTAGARLAALSRELGGARTAFARVADAGGASGVPELEGALASFAGMWSASATAIQLGAEHLASGATAAAGVYEQTDRTAMPATARPGD
jgi:hypothetical protein